MTGAEITAVLTGVVLFGAALRTAPVIWRFVVAMARLPHMTEQIWSEFGRNGGSTTRDRIEHIAREVGDARAAATSAGTALAAGTFIDCYTRGITVSGILSGVANTCVRRNVRRLDYADPMRIESGIFMTSKAGAISDADFPSAPTDGTVGGIDVTNHRIYVRSGGVWKYATLT